MLYLSYAIYNTYLDLFRVSLARAVYNQKDIYLLDDCLSAVDQRVARHIFERCITGFLKGKCVVMVTNHVQFIPCAERVV
jgi:ABC-type multidrug transport system fused ATPase/permease subunit